MQKIQNSELERILIPCQVNWEKLSWWLEIWLNMGIIYMFLQQKIKLWRAVWKNEPVLWYRWSRQCSPLALKNAFDRLNQLRTGIGTGRKVTFWTEKRGERNLKISTCTVKTALISQDLLCLIQYVVVAINTKLLM